MTTAQNTSSDEPLAESIVARALDKKGTNVVLLNPGPESTIADWYIICDGDNPTHTKAIAGNIILDLKRNKRISCRTEGLEQGRWILIDCGNIVVHVMLPELRAYYELESLWQGCPSRHFGDNKQAVGRSTIRR